MDRKTGILAFVGLLIMLAAVLGLVMPADIGAEIITVPDDYPTIQGAADSAAVGDTVYVRSGTYYEHVTLNKSLTLWGEDRETTVIDGGGTGKVVTVTSSYVNVRGLTIRNSGNHVDQPDGDQDAGLAIVYANHSLITDCVFTSNGLNGIYLLHSSDNTIQDCDVSYNNVVYYQGGIHLRYSERNAITGNNVYSNTGPGITVRSGSSNSRILRNNVHSNGSVGIHIGHSSYCAVDSNLAYQNDPNGMDFDGGSYNIARCNEIFSNLNAGIVIYFGAYTDTFTGNVIRANGRGIDIGYDGSSCWGHVFYWNDILDNGTQVILGPAVYGCTWDDGYPRGGNKWSDYSGLDVYSGPEQNLPGPDGIGDTPYVIDSSNVDTYPLMVPTGPSETARSTWGQIKAQFKD